MDHSPGSDISCVFFASVAGTLCISTTRPPHGPRELANAGGPNRGATDLLAAPSKAASALIVPAVAIEHCHLRYSAQHRGVPEAGGKWMANADWRRNTPPLLLATDEEPTRRVGGSHS